MVNPSAMARELLRREVERRARAAFYRDRAARRAGELREAERELRKEASPARRLAVATLGSPVVRRSAVAIRAVARLRPGRRAPSRTAPPLGAGGAPAQAELLERAARERRAAERGLRRERNRLGDLEWRLRVHGLHLGRQARGLLVSLGALLWEAHAVVAGGVHTLVAPPIASLLGRRRRDPTGLDPPPGGWPRVTAVVHGRPLQVIAQAWRLLTATDYPALAPRIVGRRRRGTRFDSSVADVIRSADGDLVLVCTEATASNPDWLAQLVLAAMADDQIGAVAPRATGAAVDFDLRAGAPLPRRSLRPAALSGECIVLRTARLQPEMICGEYVGDLWAVDACVAIREAGSSIEEREASGLRVPAGELDPGDIEVLRSRWGPLLRRRVLGDLIRGGGEWCARGARATSPAGGDARLGAICGQLGWQLTEQTEADLELALEEGSEVPRLVARWILASSEPGAPRQPAVSVTADRGKIEGAADRFRQAMISSLNRASFVIRLGAGDWSAAVGWGDYFLAAALRDRLLQRGHQVLLQVAGDQGSAPESCMDVLLHLRGRRSTRMSPGQLNLIWQISHPTETADDELEAYDAVLVASRAHAHALSKRLDVPVHLFFQFTDPERFHPGVDRGRTHELLFVGNWRYVFRRIVWDVLPTDRDLALIGQGWEYLAPEHLLAEHVPNAELATFYTSCSILLCDHWDDMRERGFISNRIFDGLACGAFIISDHFEALVEELPGALETYRDAGELREKVDRYLSSPEDRRERCVRGRNLVLQSHTSERRADALLQLVVECPAIHGRPFTAALRTNR